MLTRLKCSVVGLAVCASLGWASPVHADAVTYWNEVTLRAATAGRPGPPGLLDVALSQAAVHDAVQAFEGRFEPYLVSIPDAAGSPAAAVAAAAHDVLVGIYPAQQQALDSEYVAYLTANGLVGDPGLAIGEQAAAAMLTQYRAAPSAPQPPYVGGTEPGMWRPTPSYIGTPPVPAPFSPMAVVYLAAIRPFTLVRPSQFRPEPPPPLASEQYRHDYDEVKTWGARFDSPRTAAQTDLAYFWTDNFFTQWNRALRGIADAHVPGLGDRARLFALVSLAFADSVITCWESKLHYSFWRPVTAIQEGDSDGNAGTIGDPAWQPLVNTPNYPDYTSGANVISGAATAVLSDFFATDDLPFTVTSNAPLVVQRVRSYDRFSAAAEEVVEARILLGIHFRFADEEARRQGARVGHWAFTKFLRPLPARR